MFFPLIYRLGVAKHQILKEGLYVISFFSQTILMNSTVVFIDRNVTFTLALTKSFWVKHAQTMDSLVLLLAFAGHFWGA